MDLVEVFDGTFSPPNNVVNHQITNSEHNTLEIGATMEPNNLSQSAAATDITASVEVATATQTFIDPNLELKLPVLSSSSSDSESEERTDPAAGTSAGNEGERVASPPPNCAICLGRCKNKCFTDSCMHQFCFKCLCEWSKVKPECPLCKQTFKSIIHNVKSIHQFEEYHVQPPTVQIAHPPFEMDFQEMRIFGVVHPGHNRNHTWNEVTHRPFFYGDFAASSPYSTASTGGSISAASGSSSNRSVASSGNGSGVRNQYVYRGELLDLYRQEYPGAIANSGTLSQLWRRYVYDRKLYAMPVADITGRFRESSARFYRENPSQIHRLMPWINRDIVCLLRQTQHDVTTVLESINSALTLMNILSPAFRRRLQSFLGAKTAHFIHELNNFARSPYDMIGYDRAVQYLPQTHNEEIIIEFSSSDESTDNEPIDVAGDGGNNTSTSRSRSTNVSSINAINLTIHNRLTSASTNAGGNRGGGVNSVSLSERQDDVSLVIDLRGGESDNNETISNAQANTISSNFQNSQSNGSDEDHPVLSGIHSTSENIELTSGSSDECEFVLERKPPHLRTPEMVSLDSASDSDVVFVEESKPLNKTSFSSSDGEFNEGSTEHKLHHGRHQNKIAALVEAKKRNQASNVVKSEQQDTHTDVYNLGASTSAALRLSLQRRADKSRRSDEGVSGKNLRRRKYSLRNNDNQMRTERHAPRRRGKRLDSESSYSSTSSSTTISSSSSTTTSTNSSASSSDEDYVASTSQRKIASSTGRGLGTQKLGRNSRKTKNRKISKGNSRKTAKRDYRKRKNNDYSSDNDEDEDGHMGKNFALIMAINERRKRQKQKNFSKDLQGEESDGENSWRFKAINEPLRKQQQQRYKSSCNTNERKRKHKTYTEDHQLPTENKRDGKRRRHENQAEQERETEHPISFLNSVYTSSDESDNINLIELKTKLTGQDSHKELSVQHTNTHLTSEMTTNLEADTTITNHNNSEINMNIATVTSSSGSVNINTSAITSSATTEYTIIPTNATTQIAESINNTSPRNRTEDVDTLGTANETTNSIVESTTGQNDLFHFSDDSNDNIQRDNEHGHIDSSNAQSIRNYQHDQDQLLSSSSNNYNGNPSHQIDDNGNHHNHRSDVNDTMRHDDENLCSVPTTINLNESNVFGDGTSMSATTTDTILHETAEQISSAAVNFYNPQQVFNTADFADENSTNSSSSDSSVSSSTTTQSSSTNSSSSNSNSYTNYGHS